VGAFEKEIEVNGLGHSWLY